MSISNSWKSKNLPLRQLEVVEEEIAMLKGARPKNKKKKKAKIKAEMMWNALADAIRECIPEDNLKLMEIGCASGYYSELFEYLLKGKFLYSGSDYSEPMIELAREKYPDVDFSVLDVRKIDLEDRSCEVVFSAAVLEHVPEWIEGVKELARITDKYLILHKMPVGKNFITENKVIYDDVEVCFNTFSENVIVDMVCERGFELVFNGKTNPHPKNVYKIFIFRRST